MKGIKFALALIILMKSCFCWWDLGHMLVAKVAEVTLLKEDPDAYELANRIASILNIFSHGKVNNFVESACWPDDLKQYYLRAMDNWHFIDVPVNMTSVIEFINVTSNPDDAIGILTTANNSLNTWKEFEISNMNQEFEKSLLLRYLIHVLGDIHQPLHSSTLVNDQFPDGDQGGNLFLIKYSENIENLHKLFDSGANRLGQAITRPLSHENNKYLRELAEDYIEEFPKEEIPELSSSKEFKEWIIESHGVAKDFIYAEIEYNSKPSDKYMTKAYQIIKRRIALGGYRLAEIIKTIKNSHDISIKITEEESLQEAKFLGLAEQ